MKKIILSFAVIFTALMMVSCGGSSGRSGSNSSENVADTAAVVLEETPALETAVVKEPLSISLLQNYNYCVDNKPDFLTIKGGTPFADENKPYKVTVKKNNFSGTVKVGKFKEKDGAMVVDVKFATDNQSEEGYTLVLIVTDADDNKQEIERYLEYCP